MKESRLAQLLAERKPALGCWITLTDPAIAIMLARAGYDWVMIDTEHNPFTEAQVQGVIHALRGTDVTAIVRVRSNAPADIEWILDAGAGGIIVPMAENAEDVAQAIRAAKYHPLGERGYGPLRATDFWADTAEYNARANTEVLLICQIERSGAVDDIEQIVQMPGLDGIWIGPGDLAHSLGHMGDVGHQDVQEAMTKIINAANHHGKPWGIPVRTVEDLMRYVNQGAILMTLGSDSFLLNSGARELAQVGRAALAKSGLRESRGTRQGSTAS